MENVYEVFEFILGLREFGETTPRIIKQVTEEFEEFLTDDKSILYTIPVEGYDELEDDICIGYMDPDLQILVKFVLANRGEERKFSNGN